MRWYNRCYNYTIIYIALSYKCTLHIGEVYTSCFISSLNISAGKTPIPNFSIPFAYLSVGGKLYYNSNLFLNESINPTSIGL